MKKIIILSVVVIVCALGVIGYSYKGEIAAAFRPSAVDVDADPYPVRLYPYYVTGNNGEYYIQSYGLLKNGNLRLFPQRIELAKGTWIMYNRYTNQIMDMGAPW